MYYGKTPKARLRAANDITLAYHMSYDPGNVRIVDSRTGTELVMDVREAAILAQRLLEAARSHGVTLVPQYRSER
jgi:hypothetical protein